MNIGGTTINLPGQIKTIQDNTKAFGFNIIGIAINTLLLGITIVSLFFIVYGGIQWITSEGDAKKFEGARNTIIYACIGLGIAFLSFLIVSVLTTFLQLNPSI